MYSDKNPVHIKHLCKNCTNLDKVKILNVTYYHKESRLVAMEQWDYSVLWSIHNKRSLSKWKLIDLLCTQ